MLSVVSYSVCLFVLNLFACFKDEYQLRCIVPTVNLVIVNGIFSVFCDDELLQYTSNGKFR